MNSQTYLNEQLTHHLISERVARASEPRLHTDTRRHRLAQQLHRFADRIEA